jgi:hypothetical protein
MDELRRLFSELSLGLGDLHGVHAIVRVARVSERQSLVPRNHIQGVRLLAQSVICICLQHAQIVAKRLPHRMVDSHKISLATRHCRLLPFYLDDTVVDEVNAGLLL